MPSTCTALSSVSLPPPREAGPGPTQARSPGACPLVLTLLISPLPSPLPLHHHVPAHLPSPHPSLQHAPSLPASPRLRLFRPSGGREGRRLGQAEGRAGAGRRVRASRARAPPRPAGHAHHAVLLVPVGALGAPAGRARAHHGAAAARLALLLHLLRGGRAAPGSQRVPEPRRPRLLRRREPGGRGAAGRGPRGRGIRGGSAAVGRGREAGPVGAGPAGRVTSSGRGLRRGSSGGGKGRVPAEGAGHSGGGAGQSGSACLGPSYRLPSTPPALCCGGLGRPLRTGRLGSARPGPPARDAHGSRFKGTGDPKTDRRGASARTAGPWLPNRRVPVRSRWRLALSPRALPT